MPFVRPVTDALVPVTPVATVTHETPSSERSTIAPVIAEPPSLTGLVHVRSTTVSPEIADRPVGSPGTVAGISAAEFADAPTPTAFRARTRNM